MEVHAHSHTARKKWTHYLWEFLMLFLAVFCGFLAENQREHMIEHQREKTYINSLISDLKGDTAIIKYVISFCITKVHGMDTLSQLLNKDMLSTEEEKELYYLNSRYAASVLRPAGAGVQPGPVPQPQTAARRPVADRSVRCRSP